MAALSAEPFVSWWINLISKLGNCMRFIIQPPYCNELSTQCGTVMIWTILCVVITTDALWNEIWRIMHGVTWIMIFWSCERWFANEFYLSLINIFVKSPHLWPKKIIIHGNECIIMFLTCCFISMTHNSAKNNHPSLMLPLLARTVFSDSAL